jgi:DNA-binding SARP family transcriptional activator/ATP/maltotriose-dependent transcriptional regulator MalT
MARPALAQLIDGALYIPAPEATAPIIVGSPAWVAWLADPANRAFSVPTEAGALTVRREQKGGGAYWYAYHRTGPRLRKAYLGKTADLNLERIAQALATLHAPVPTVTQTDPLTMRLLGTPQFVRGATPLTLASAKAVALLGYLALAEEPQRRERIQDLFWPESLPTAAGKNLRNTLWAIRTTLGADLLSSAGERIGLSPAVQHDLSLFLAAAAQPNDTPPDALQHALAHYRGPLLDGVTLHDAPELELWLTRERERLLQYYRTAVEALLARQQAAADWPALAQTAEQALTHDDLHETAHRALMEALARRGDRAGALRRYERLRTLLDNELGVPPDAASEALHDAIVRGALNPTAPERLPLPAPPRPTPPPRQPFVGRVHESAALDAEWAHAAQGTARVVVISGELGIGKSRLWQHWAAGAADPHLIELQCLEATRHMPFAPLIAIFGNATWSARAAAALGANLPPWLQDVTRLLPTLNDLPHALIGGAPAAERQRLFEAFVQALLAFTEPPHLLALHDLHWADSATLDWLDYALHRLRATPLLLVVSYRTEAVSREHLRRIAQWEREVPLRRMELSRLTTDEAADLLTALGAKDQSRLVHESAGNPYFLTELARSAVQGVPPALSDLVRARIDALPEPAQQVLQAAAVLEPDIEAPILVQISALDETTTLEALDTLFSSGMLIEHDERAGFSHPLIATIVRATLSRVRRATVHRRAATALAQIYANHLPAQAGRIAAHYREAGDRPQAAHYAMLAGDYALSVTAAVEAVQFYRQALADDAGAECRLRLGRALAWCGEQAEARALIQQAYADFAAHNDRHNMALAKLLLADLALTHSGYAEAGQLAEQARDLIGGAEAFIAASAHILIGTAARVRGDFATAQRHIDACLELAAQHNLLEVQMYAAIGLSNLRAEQGDQVGAYAAAQQIISLAQQVGYSFYEVIGHNSAAYRATLLGDLAGAHRHIRAGLELADARGLEMPRQWLYSTRGELALAEHAWEEAATWLQRARVEAMRQNNTEQVAMIDANLGRVAAEQGDLLRAEELLTQSWQASAAGAGRFQYVQIGLWLADVLSRRGDDARARSTWEAATAHLSADN